MTRLLIAASGTGGHIFPALAVAESLPTAWEVSWLGVPNRLETQLIPKKYELITIRARGLQSKGWRKILDALCLLWSTKEVVQTLRTKRIEIVFTTGGYIAAPTILGAFLSRIPVVLHESNAMPGRVTRLLARLCTLVAIGLPPAARLIHCGNIVITGTPVRSDFLASQILPSWAPAGSGPLVLIMGGSQGAVGLNQMVRSVLPWLLEQGCRVVHLTGSNDNGVNKLIHQNYAEKDFSNEVPALLQNSDLVISRAGAGALSELAICGVPAILIPYPSAADHHQDINAGFVAEMGAAIIIHQHPSSKRALLDALARLFTENSNCSGVNVSDSLLGMQQRMKRLAVIDANHKIIKILEKLTQ